jgi:hypothetical protein
MKVSPNDSPKKAARKIAEDFRNREKKNKEKSLSEYPTYKYSRPFLHEAIILGGIPRLISYAPKFDRILPFENIQEPSRILRPPNREEYPYLPYEFKDEQELEECLKRAKSETIDSLYQKAKSIIKKYNDQDEHKLILLAIDLFWSYFQDKFGTTHYILVVGDNDSGKSSIGNTFEAVGYRVVNMTSPTAANIFRVFGLIEPGQCVLVLDEADKIDGDVDIMNILKSGYDYNKRVPKTNSNTWKQEFFYVYGLKIIIAEKSPSRFKAKGLLDRAFGFTVYPGEPQLDIKEVTARHERDPQLDQALNELLDFRKLMLVYRLLHFEDSIVDLDIGVIRRNRELCKPYLRLFYNTAAHSEIMETFQTFLDSKNSKKSGSIEAILIPVIIDITEQHGDQVPSNDVWELIKDGLNGESNGSNEYRISDYTLYRNTITRILEDKFGAEVKHTNKGNKIIFNLEKLRRIQRSYEIKIRIKTSLKSEGGEGGEGIRGFVRASYDGKSIEDISNGNGKDKDISRNGDSEGYPIPPAHPQEPSLHSQPSPIPIEIEMSDEDKAAKLREYDRLSALARKRSKEAAHVRVQAGADKDSN